jgi:hypothetical protein
MTVMLHFHRWRQLTATESKVTIELTAAVIVHQPPTITGRYATTSDLTNPAPAIGRNQERGFAR